MLLQKIFIFLVLFKMFLQVKIVAAVEVAVADGFHDVVLADGDADVEAGVIVRGEKERINSDSLNF